MLISVDPGKKHAAAAVWRDGLLQSVHLDKGGGPIDTAEELHADLWIEYHYEMENHQANIAIECMQVYTPGKSEGNPNDLIQVALMVGAFCGFADVNDIRIYPPAEWKGQVPKPVMQDRILEVLSVEERSHLERLTGYKTKDHNIYDAVGIGLFHLRRIGKFKKVNNA